MEGKLIKIDRNGSKHYEGWITCDRCGGGGIFYVAVCNGQGVPAQPDGGTCWKCLGAGKVMGRWIERTPEYQAKLDARRAKRQAEINAQREAEAAQREAERREREEREAAERAAEAARIAAQKAISQHVGEIGQKIELPATYEYTATFETHYQWMEVTMHVHRFKDAQGNVLVWKTQSSFRAEQGAQVTLKGTVKAHSEYKDEKQTELTRCKVEGR